MEARLARLEVAVAHMLRDLARMHEDVRAIRADIKIIRTTNLRLLLGALIGTGLGLAGMMAIGFGWR